MAETVTLLEHRVRQVVERLRSLDAERERLTRELDGLRAGEQGRRQAVAEAARALDGVARELSEDLREDA
jgi:cell division protein FtsB